VLWVALGLFIAAVLGLTFRYIPNDRVGIVEKLWSASGSVRHGIIALQGEAGFQPDLLRGGWHVLMPFQYRLHKMSLVTIPAGQDRLRVRARRPAAAADADAGEQRGPRTTSRTWRRSAVRRPARAAAEDPPRRHLRDQHRRSSWW
jgi:hypothetical protein